MAEAPVTQTDPLVSRGRFIAAGLLLGVLLWSAARLLPHARATDPVGDQQPPCFEFVDPLGAGYVPS